MKNKNFFLITILSFNFILFVLNYSYSQNLDSGLVAYYPFNGNANDASGNGNNGTVIGATLTTDRFNLPNKAYFFDNPNRSFSQSNTNLINCGHGSSLQLNNAVSISLWFNSISSPYGSYLIGKAATSGGYEYVVCWDLWSDGSGLKSDIGGISPDEIGTTFYPTNNIWYHIVVTWAYQGNFSIYLNGSLLKTQAATHGPIIPTTQDVVIGCIRPSGEPSIRYFNGKIDDIKIFNRVLTQVEITQLYTGIKNLNKEIPSKYNLYQNYPNPFNPNTNIKYQITKNKLTTLRIFDILGKEIMTLVNEKQSPGIYEISLDGSDLPSGLYFYTICSGDFTDTKRMILIK